jgi:hypothetical protein
VDNELPAPVLLYRFNQMYAKDINVPINPMVETVAEPQQVSAAQQLADFRAGLTNLSSSAASSLAPRTQPASTGRMVLANSNVSFPPGVTNADSGEMCLKGVNEGFSDAWCLRGVEEAYPSSLAMPRYLTLENDGYSGFSGLTAVQMPGLRVRPSQLIPGSGSSDATLPVTDFAVQAFTIAGGLVSGDSCATVPGIELAGAAMTDMVPFVKAPGPIGQLQLSGTVIAANTLSLTLCNPSTRLQNYPAGTYSAFLVAGTVAANPPISGFQPLTTNPLTTTQGDLVVGDINGNPSRLAGNSTTTGAILTQVGNGTIANEPVWQTAPSFYGGNLTGLNGSNITTGAVGIGYGGTGAVTAAQALANLNGASLSASVSAFAGELTGKQVGGLNQVDQFGGSDIGAQLTACLAGLSSAYGGLCDARNYTGTITMASNVTLNVANTTVLLPCATISTSASFVVPAGVRNVTLKGCGLRGASTASGSQGGTVIAYSGSGNAVQVGDPTYAADTMGFHMDNLVLNTTGTNSASATGFTAYRTQELDLESLYFLGNSNQTGMTLDGTKNYTGGTFLDLQFDGYHVAVNGLGHRVANPATTDWMNASTFVRLHIDCPTSGESPITGTYGINLQQGDGNTFTGGDVEGCATALHLGSNAQNNTIVGLRNENSNSQVVADSGSSNNSWITGGTLYVGKLTDNGTQNSFLDTFHRTFNGAKGDWYASLVDATVTNHLRLGIGSGNERGLLNEVQTDYGNRWLEGYTDGVGGQQTWQVGDLLNNANRIVVQQYNHGNSNTNNQTLINSAGTGAVVLNGSTNSGTGGVVFSSGGATPAQVAQIDGGGNLTVSSCKGCVPTSGPGSGSGTVNPGIAGQIAGYLTSGSAISGLPVTGTGNVVLSKGPTLTGNVTMANGSNAAQTLLIEPGASSDQTGAVQFANYLGAAEWTLRKDGSNYLRLTDATNSLDRMVTYQNGNTILNAGNGANTVAINNTANSGTGGLTVYGGGNNFSTAEVTMTGTGNVTANGFLAGKVLENAASQMTVKCSVKGSVVFSQPEQGSSYKKVVVYENGCTGTAIYTFPTAFAHTPQVLSQSLVATATAVSLTALTITGSSSTGFLDLDGF